MRLELACAGAVAAALVFAGSAGAHIDVAPPFLGSRGTSTLSLTGHNDRDAPMTGFAVTVPRKLRILDALPADGWDPRVEGSTATWSGGSLAPKTVATFELELEPSGTPGPAEIVVEQLYPRGSVARWPLTITIVPGTVEPTEPVGRPWWAIGVIALLGLAIAALLGLALLRTRRRPLQER